MKKRAYKSGVMALLLLLILSFVSACQPNEAEPAAAPVDATTVDEAAQPAEVTEVALATQTVEVAPTEQAAPAAEEIPTAAAASTTESRPEEVATPEDGAQDSASGESDDAAPEDLSAAALQRFPVAGLFAGYSEQPVVNLDTGDTQFMEFPGAVTFHDDQFHMFANVIDYKDSAVSAVHYFTSPDGIAWTPAVDGPLITSDELLAPYGDLYTAYASSVLVEDDGTWVLYFSTIDRETWWPPTFEGGIGRATAPAPAGPWTPDDALVLEPGSEGSWDSDGVRDASVVRTDEGYVLYYTGYLKTGSPNQYGEVINADAAIGMATSDDGVTWTRMAEPILTGSGEKRSWDQYIVVAPSVLHTPDGWIMAYSGGNQATCCKGGTNPRKHGLAISEDGLEWTRSDDQMFNPTSVFGAGNAWDKALVYHDGAYYLLMQVGPMVQLSSGHWDIDWNIHLATFEGSLGD